ncbi:hypothetical protein FBU30_007135 [Linnemannia zychae]|nr:hypothetical protein FBU30_007135 [Linnemannia zychae]
MARISGTIIPSLILQTSPNASALEIKPNSRIAVQLLDVSLMDAPSVTLGEEEIMTNDQALSFPIPFSIIYNADSFQPSHSLTLAVRVYNISKHPWDGNDGDLTWITTSRHLVITNDNPSDNIEVEIDPITNYDDVPIAPKSILTGHIKASPSTPASSSHGIGPNAKILVQLLDVSLMDAPSVTISEQRILLGAGDTIPFPIPFGILYDPKAIVERNVYSVSVRVEELNSDKLIWISTWANNVLTRDAPTENVEVEVDLV